MTSNFIAMRNAACVACTLLTSAAVQANTPPSLEELLQQPIKNEAAAVEVSTSARGIKSVRNSPQATYIVTDDDILTFNLKNLAEILSVMPGLYTSSDSAFEYLAVRGIGRPGDYNSRILFLVDGTRVNDNVYDAGLTSDDFYIDTELIERVEYSPGPGSALYGNNAFLGVVNVITKRSNKLRGAEVSVSADNQHERRLRASYGMRQVSGHEAWFSLSHSEQDHIPIANATLQPVFQPFRVDNQDSSNKVAATYRYKQLQMQAAAVRRIRQEPSFITDSLERAAVSKSVSENYFIALQHSTELTADLAFFTNVSTNQFAFDTLTPFELFPGNIQQYLFAVKGKWTNADMRFSYQGVSDHQLLFGIDAQRDHHQRYELSIKNIGPVISASDNNQRLGLYFQDEWRFSASQLLVAGFRYDHTDNEVAEVSPKLSWIWQPTATSTLKLSYGTAFRAPNGYESETNRFYQVEVPEAEQVKTTELIWNAQPGSHLSYYAALYYSKFSSLITSRAGQAAFIEFFNDQQVRSYGIESGLDYVWNFGGRLNLSLSLQQAEYRDGESLTNTPQHLFKAMYSQPLPWQGWQLNWRSVAAAKRQNIAGDIPGYSRHDISLHWQPWSYVDVVLGVKNLTDKLYTDAPRPSANEFYQPGRRAELSIRWRFGQ